MMRLTNRFSRGFLTHDKGDVAPMFGLMAIAMFLMMGGAVDFGRWMHARKVTMSALDAAVLAGGRALQLDPNDVNGAIAAANKFYAENVKGRDALLTDTIHFQTSENGTAFEAAGNAYIATTLLHLANISQLPLLDDSGVDHAKSILQAGGNAEINLEISLMLDVTGSMSGQKIADLKTAANDLVDIVVWNDQSAYTSKVALVPFSQAVNAGATYFHALTDKNTSSNLASLEGSWAAGLPTVAGLKSSLRSAVAALADLRLVTPAYAGNGGWGGGGWGGGGGGWGGGDSSPSYSPCVVDRSGSNALTDAAPSTDNYFQVYDVAKQSNSWTKDMSCLPSTATLLPLTNNKTSLHNKINSLVANGYTAGHIGTAFAWYMLSPNFSSVWPSASTPAAYSSTSTKKIAILMTDGEYNTSYNGNSNGNSAAQAVSLCTNMKAQGITVYTVGFDLGGNQTAINTLSSCATDPGHAYVADNGEELQQAFRDIALKISDLHLTR